MKKCSSEILHQNQHTFKQNLKKKELAKHETGKIAFSLKKNMIFKTNFYI
jgi:hypothetical protein